MSDLLDELETIEIPDPTELIISQIRELIRSGRLQPGDKLPSEAALQKKFNVKRGVVRDAIQKLEFYGILKTKAQSGTVVSSLGPKALEGLLTNILKLEKDDSESLIDTRMVLESHAAALASERATPEELAELKQVQEDFAQKVSLGQRELNSDILFHLKIAEYAHSSMLNSLITLISPDILKHFHKNNRIPADRLPATVKEHNDILQAILERDPERADKLMREHIKTGYAESIINGR